MKRSCSHVIVSPGQRASPIRFLNQSMGQTEGRIEHSLLDSYRVHIVLP